ncbi:Na+/H+ antiporter subunit E [Mycobacterium sp. HUMS_1102779]|uniref:Na+/H+ antiporter subunit E n=1 Tax=Mycobacterium sp. HUMS_1102779 TaxID=3383487 RepID=UPI00389A321A
MTVAVWMASLSSFAADKFLVGTICTLPCAMVARPARQANDGKWRFPVRWLGWLPTVLRDIAAQTVTVWLYALIPSRRHAELTTLRLPEEDDPPAAGRRATAALSFSTTPGTVVCSASERDGTLVLHRVGRPGRLEVQVTR